MLLLRGETGCAQREWRNAMRCEPAGDISPGEKIYEVMASRHRMFLFSST